MKGIVKGWGALIGMVVSLAGAGQQAPQTRALLDQVYQSITGYSIDQGEIEVIAQAGGNDTYGEITFEGVAQLATLLAVGPGDVFYDLGCGVGKMVLQIYLDKGVRKAVGIELSASRCTGAQKALKRLKQRQRLPVNRHIKFIQGDIATADLSDATVIYMASTCFSPDFMRKITSKLATLRKGLRVATLVPLPDAQGYGFKALGQHLLPMSWDQGGNWVYVYKLE